MSDKTGSILVVGGGISGLQTSLNLAESGFRVYLLEKKPTVGGTMAQLDKTFPTNDCSLCILSPKLVELGRHRNVELLTYSELEKVEGEPGNFTVVVTRYPRRVNVEKCTGCGICADECPVNAIDEYQEGLMFRDGIHVDYSQAVPLAYTIDEEECIGCGICEYKCEADAIEYDQEKEEIELKVGTIILSPGFEEFDPAEKEEYMFTHPNVIQSTQFERLLSATGPSEGHIIRPSDGEIPRKIAWIQCVGSRDKDCNEYCSSVCCMYSAKQAIIAKEHEKELSCTIFSMDVRAPGKGFQEYIDRAEGLGVEYIRARPSKIIESEENDRLIIRYEEGGDLEEKEFDIVVLSVGIEPSTEAKKLAERIGIELDDYGFAETRIFSPLQTSVPGVFASGVFESPKDIPESITQATGAASRSSELISSERGKMAVKKEYPPMKDITGERPRVGVFVCNCGINIGGVVDVPEVTEYAKALPRVTHAENNLYTCSQDTQERIKEKIREEGLNRIVVASCTPRTHEPLFQETCREAGLNPYLFEMANIRDQCSWVHSDEPERATEKAKDLVRMAVAKARLLQPLERAKTEMTKSCLVIGGGLSGMTAALGVANQGFEVHLVEKEDKLGGNLRNIKTVLGDEDPQKALRGIIKEVRSNKRIRVHLKTEVEDVSGYVGKFTSKLSTGEEIEHGTAIVAIGAEEYKPDEDEYLYSEEEVMTQFELEERLEELDADEVVMIQCVGSRNEERPYCSRICCSNAIKNALLLKERTDAKVYVLYRDVRTYGLKESFYEEAQKKGVRFIRFEEDEEPKVKKGKRGLEVTVRDQLLDRKIKLNPDALVLSSGVVPPEDNKRLSELLKVSLGEEGFFLEAHQKLRPVDLAKEGIFLCGMAHYPKLIEESISQANAAAQRACGLLSKKAVKAKGIIVEVREELCSGCGACISVCPYDAIEKREGKAEVTETLCQGCGACTVACRNGAIQQRKFKDSQIAQAIRAFGG